MRVSRITALLCLIPPAAVACSASAPGGGETQGGHTTVVMMGVPDAGDAGIAPGDDGGDALPAATNVGYALCAHTSASCDPDVAMTAQSCALAPDGGPYDPSGGYGGAPLACRVQPASSVNSNGLGYAPVCAVAGSGDDGASCKTGSDCGAGLDCVGAGTCRHYCCEGNAMCSADEFCDIQPLTIASTTRVPVCMPIEPAGGCKLQPTNAGTAPTPSCPTGETCTIVREDGTTGCAETGDAKAGDPCDATHCGAGLVCLGAPDARVCYQLCSTQSTSCTAPQTCQGGLPLFQDPSIGVCR